MRELIDSKFSKQPSLFPSIEASINSIVFAARSVYDLMHQVSVNEPDRHEELYRTQLVDCPPLKKLKRAMDEWCAIWFWPTDQESLLRSPSPLTFHKPAASKDHIVDSIAAKMKFFHWEMEFPDVFTPERSGFDGLLGNPPWETLQQESMEFFSEYDPLYRTYTKQAALAKQVELFATDLTIQIHWENYCSTFAATTHWIKNCGTAFDVSLSRGREEKQLQKAWAEYRAKHFGFADRDHPFVFQGRGKTYSYKAFLEVAFHLLKPNGRLGFIVPSGLYSDAGCHDIRELFLNRSTWEWLFGFINWEQIFNIYYRFKFVCTIVERRPPLSDHAIRSCFGRYALRDWEAAESVVFPLPKANILEFSPKSLSILEITNQRDLDVCRKIYANSFRIGDCKSGWEIDYAQEFNMTSDSRHFPTREKWEAKGFKPDVFGRWIGPDGEVALPLYEGRMIGQFDFSKKGYVSGRGRTAKWREMSFEQKQIEPQYLVSSTVYENWEKAICGPKVAFMDIASSTNARTTFSVVHSGVPFGHSAPVLSLEDHDLEKSFLVSAIMNSIVFDFTARQRIGGLHLTWFIVEECPLPAIAINDDDTVQVQDLLLHNAARLTLIHRRFAPEWLRLRHSHRRMAKVEWKKLWAVAEIERLKLRLQNDAVCADGFGLLPDDFDWIVRNDPTDPKGFWRVDKEMPSKERYPALAAAAFRAFKDGNWSVESAAKLSNDEFFEIIGIPEMTTGPDPLIRKRDGCHRWEPEKFAKDDPRYGWTWDHCWQDAVALLGSEEAVRKYVEGKPDEEDKDADINPKVKKAKAKSADNEKGLF